MESYQHLTSNQVSTNFDYLLAEFSRATQAVQMYDLKTIEEALYNASNLYREIEASSHNKDEIVTSKFFVDFIDVSARTARYIFAFNEEWYNKAWDELTEAEKVCNKLSAALSQLSLPFFEQKGIPELFTRFQFLVVFYNLIIHSAIDITRGHIAKQQGHYVDEIKIYKSAALQLKQMNQFRLHTNDDETRSNFRSVVDFCNKMAETYERRSERLMEKRKQIEFLSPSDKKVFIVHGHDVGVLRELKEILRDLGVEPIILADEYDDGKTVIEKFEHHARQCALAFVLITPDDWVEKASTKYFQARPNVLFELGWFCGRYGRDNVRILRRKETPLPSDLNGIVTIDFTERLEEFYRKIKLDMERMGILETSTAGQSY